MNFIAVFAGGGLGSLIRFFISMAVQKQSLISFPLATLSANILSCIIMAFSLRLLQSNSWDSPLFLFLITGFCGGLSTFSTFSWESIHLLKTGNHLMAFLNILMNIAFCFGIIFITVGRQRD